jgi:halogenation protein CepH
MTNGSRITTHDSRLTTHGSRLTDPVVVIGGGPAGSTAATMLARKGLRVLLLERERFPREHVGESLLPASLPLLEELGALPAIENAGFIKKWGAVMVWGTSDALWSWYFGETNRRYPHAYQVWRAEFDSLLLQNSAEHGVEVRQGCRVLEVLGEGGRAAGVRFLDAHGEEQRLRARFVVDASGQTGLLGRARGLRRADPYFRNLAVYGYFSDVEGLPAPDDGSIFIEAYPEGWCWTIPLQGRFSVGVVVDSVRQQQAIQREGSAVFFRRQLAQAPHTARRLRDAMLVSGPALVKDWSYVSNAVAGAGWVLAGDAACFVDPLFSSGVHLALSSGVLAAAHVTTAIAHPELETATGLAYQGLYAKQYSHFRELAKLFYASNRSVESYFWEARRITGGDDSMSPRQAFIEAVAGQPAQGYERAVLEHGAAPAGFLEGVHEVESRRAGRRAALASAFSGGIDRALLARLAPRLAGGARLERKPVLGEGEFVLGDVLTTDVHPEGIPISPLVAHAVALIDGRRSVADLLAVLATEFASVAPERLAAAVLPALQILYADGAIAELTGLAAEHQ